MSNKRDGKLVLRSLVPASLLVALQGLSSPVLAQDAPPAASEPAPEVTPATAAPVAKKKGGGGPSLGLNPESPQAAGLVTTTADAPAAAPEPETGEWKFDVTGYFRAPLRFSWGPPTVSMTPGQMPTSGRGDAAPDAAAGAGRELHRLAVHEQLRRPLDRAELPLRQRPGEGDGADRLVQRDGLGVPAAGVEPRDQRGVPVDDLAGVHQRERAADADRGGVHEPLRRRGAIRRGPVRDLPVRADARGGRDGERGIRLERLDVQLEESFGGKLEPIPFYGAPLGTSADVVANGSTTGNANQDLPAWQPYPGPFAQESTFVAVGARGRVVEEDGDRGAALHRRVRERQRGVDGRTRGQRSGRGRRARPPRPSRTCTSTAGT